jgi:hypothetical protein
VYTRWSWTRGRRAGCHAEPRELGAPPRHGDRVGIASCLEALAAVAVAVGHAEEAAGLLGAAESRRDAIGAPVPPADRRDQERTVASLREALGDTLPIGDGSDQLPLGSRPLSR